MSIIWDKRVSFCLFFPLIILGSSSFFGSLHFSGYIFFISFVNIFILLVNKVFFRHPRLVIYTSLFLFVILCYISFVLAPTQFFELKKVLFWEDFLVFLPLIHLLFLFRVDDRLFLSVYYKEYFIFVLFIIISTITLGIIREFLTFTQFYLVDVGNIKVTLGIKTLLAFLGVDFSNQFFNRPIGGMLVFSLLGSFIFQKLKGKYGK